MTIGFQHIAPGATLLDEDDVLTALASWRRQGMRTVLVTLVGVEGGAPRQPGAQMAVAEDGSYVGYLSGGCLEQAVALEGKAVIAAGSNRLVRYGKGSPYFDIRLPCGSGLDLYFDQSLSDDELQSVMALRAERRSSVLATNLATGRSSLSPVGWPLPLSARHDDTFHRVYPAPLRLALIGNGPALTGIAALAGVTGIETLVWSTDDVTIRQLAASALHARSSEAELESLIAGLDATSAAVVVFHDHDSEPAILAKLLQTPAFYLGVLGNRAVHRARRETMLAQGIEAHQLDRLHAPIGVIPNAKSKATFAFGVLAQIMAVAKAENLIA